MTDKEDSNFINIVIICGTIILLTLIGTDHYVDLVERNLMSKNIDTAISRGVDPLSVRCSFADSKDIVCVAYASSTSHTVNKK